MNELVSILIPVYNREAFIEKTVWSALEQTYNNIEVIIVDNHSCDNTWSVLKRLAGLDRRIQIFRNDENIGPVRNWKRCIEMARGEYGKILWSDDLIKHEYLEKTVPFFKDPEIGFVFTKTTIFDDSTNFALDSYLLGKTGQYLSSFYINNIVTNDVLMPVSPGCAIFRLSDLRTCLYVDIPNKHSIDFSNIAIGNDLLVFLLIANKYKYFGFIDEALSLFRIHDTSISVQSSGARLGTFYLLTTAYFLETHAFNKKLIKRLNVMILYLLLKYTGHNSNLIRIKDFYLSNECYSIDMFFLFKKFLQKVWAIVRHRFFFKPFWGACNIIQK